MGKSMGFQKKPSGRSSRAKARFPGGKSTTKSVANRPAGGAGSVSGRSHEKGMC